MKTPNHSFKNRSSIVFLQVVVVVMALLACAALLLEPQVEGRNAGASNLEIYFNDPFLALVYAGSIPFFVGLYKAFRLLGFAKDQTMFTASAIQAVRAIRNCALIVLGFVIVEEIVIVLASTEDDGAGAIMLGLLFACGSIIVATAARLFERVLRTAAKIASENELTV